MDLSNFWWQAADAPVGIGNSLRFRGGQNLLGPAMTGAQSVDETFSAWVKLGLIANDSIVVSRAIQAGITELQIAYAGAELQKYNGLSNANTAAGIVQRDPSAWYHIVTTTEGGVGSKVYINGNLVGSNADQSTFMVVGQALSIGRYAAINAGFFDGYMAEVHYIDGQALDPTDFGESDRKGVWVFKEYTGTYGANGCYLDFSDPADIGADRSGNGNDFTPTGFITNPDVFPGTDVVNDTPTNNYALWNSLRVYQRHDLNSPNTANSVTYGGLTITSFLNHTLLNTAIPPGFVGDIYFRITSGTGQGDFQYIAGLGSEEDWNNPIEAMSAKPVWSYYYGAAGTGAGSTVFYNGAAQSTGANPVGIISGTQYLQRVNVNRNTGVVTWYTPVLDVTVVPTQVTATMDMNTYRVNDDWFLGVDSTGQANTTSIWLTGISGLAIEGNDDMCSANMPAALIPDQITGTFTGNNNADGPFIYTGCIPARIQYGTVDVKYQDRFAQSNVDFLSNGFKVRSTVSNSGTLNYTVTTTHDGGEYNGSKIPFSAPARAVSN